MKRSELKAIVKECLIEILNEGLSGNLISKSTAINPNNNLKLERKQIQSPKLAAQHKQVIDEIVGNVKDPVMASIFADTATKTLQEQNQAEHFKPIVAQGADAVAHVVANNSLDSLFGDAADKWASLAFMNDNK